MSPATSGQYLLKFEKMAENGASDGFGSNFSGMAFWLPNQLAGFLFKLFSRLPHVSDQPPDPDMMAITAFERVFRSSNLVITYILQIPYW